LKKQNLSHLSGPSPKARPVSPSDPTATRLSPSWPGRKAAGLLLRKAPPPVIGVRATAEPRLPYKTRRSSAPRPTPASSASHAPRPIPRRATPSHAPSASAPSSTTIRRRGARPEENGTTRSSRTSCRTSSAASRRGSTAGAPLVREDNAATPLDRGRRLAVLQVGPYLIL
jgi:hypothetical protein